MKRKPITPEEMAKLKAASEEYRERVWDAERAQRIEENSALVGRYFRYRNTYGSGKKWWLYAKVTGVDQRDGSLRSVQFQDDGRSKIRVDVERYSHIGGAGWTEISKYDYTNALRSFRVKLDKVLTP